VKQNAWTDCVQKAIENVKEKKLKDMLIQIKDFSNIPRKEAKFINFLVNSFRVRERDLCQRAWQAIDQQVKKLQAESKPIENGNTQQNGSTEKDGSTQQNGSTDSPMKNGHQQIKESAENNVKNVEKHSVEDDESKSAIEFKWKKSIKRKLKSAEEGTMKLKRLRKEVLEEYRTTCQDTEMNEDELKEIFVQKLGSAGVVVEGNFAKLV
jgi:cell growth-regulating nucleolar protein